jgi:HK97 family phage major capsid protein
VEKGISGFALIAKCLRGQPFTARELEAITPTPEVSKALLSGTNAANGENYLIPEDVTLSIQTLRRSYASAKELVTVLPTTTLSGSFTWESGAPAGLVSFDDGSNVPDSDEPNFKNVKFNIRWKGAIIPISNILSAVEAAGLTAYLNRWFVRKAILSENADIFAALKKDKTAKALTGMDDLQKSLNLDLDPACLVNGLIATNQTGFNLMDQEKDADGHKLLQPDPTKPTGHLFKGLPVLVYSDKQLPNEGGKAPVFYGDTKSGVWFMEFSTSYFATSTHAGFLKNQTLMRVIEGYDVIAADKDAYCYGLLGQATTSK